MSCQSAESCASCFTQMVSKWRELCDWRAGSHDDTIFIIQCKQSSSHNLPFHSGKKSAHKLSLLEAHASQYLGQTDEFISTFHMC